MTERESIYGIFVAMILLYSVIRTKKKTRIDQTRIKNIASNPSVSLFSKLSSEINFLIV